MRLLQFEELGEAKELNFQLINVSSDPPPYAILSHRWGYTDDEISFEDFNQRSNQAKLKKGFKQKVEPCCRQALEDGLTHAWIDTCCIDKSSSAELSEAINSMFRWYQDSKVCYVFLDDVNDVREDNSDGVESSLRSSVWFTRGWTLQELLAPNNIIFYAVDWIRIGRKQDMTELLSRITKIDVDALLYPRQMDACASQIMSWASGRKTSRIEDRAYSLLGLFNISMPILYGEGPKAFIRLQEEISRVSFDHTIFAWDLKMCYSGLLADSPDAFAESGNIRKLSLEDYVEMIEWKSTGIEYNMTNLGIDIPVPIRELKSHRSLYAAYLACFYINDNEPIAIYLRKHGSRFFRTRKSTHSICNSENLKDTSERIFEIEKRIKVFAPEKLLARSIRPLVRDQVASPEGSEPETLNVYQIDMACPGEVLAVYPMPQEIEGATIVIETEASCPWVVSISIGDSCEMKVIMAVENDELVTHIDFIEDFNLSLIGISNALQSCENYYKSNAKSFLKTPRTEIRLRRNEDNEPVKANSAKELVAQSFEQDVTYESDPPRKVFSFWVRIGTDKDLSSATYFGFPLERKKKKKRKRVLERIMNQFKKY